MRFHFGVSFSWYKIKKFLIPFILGVLAYFGFNNITYVYADTFTNLDTSFEFQYDLTYDLSSFSFGNNVDSSFRNDYSDLGTLYEYIISNVLSSSRFKPIFFMNCYVSNDSDWFNSCSNSENTRLNVYLVDTQDSNYVNNSFNINFVGRNFGSYGKTFYSQIFTSYYYRFEFMLNRDYFQSSYLSSLISFLTSDVLNTTSSFYRTGSILLDYYSSVSSGSLSNDTSFGVSSLFSYIYDSYVDLNFTYNSSLTYDDIFVKQVFYGLLYRTQIYEDSLFPTFLDIKNGDFSITPNSNFGDSLGSFYFGDLSYSQFERFSFTYSFDTFLDSASTYFYNSRFIVKYYGRKYNTSYHYYSYEELDCSRGSLTSNSLSNSKRVNLLYSSGTCSGDLSVYDNFMITFTPYLADEALNTSFSNLVVNSPTYYFRGTMPGSDFFDVFYVTRDFKYLISSNSSVTITALSESKYFSASYYDISSSSFSSNYDFTAYNTNQYFHSFSVPNNITFNNFFGLQATVSTNMNKGLYIYGLPDINPLNPLTLYLFSNTSTIVSEQFNGSMFNYYNSSGEIVNSTINIPELSYSEVSTDDKFSVSSWVDVVNSFFDSLNDDLLNIHVLIDTAFFSLNPFIQNFLIVLTILFCLRILFNLIHK